MKNKEIIRKMSYADEKYVAELLEHMECPKNKAVGRKISISKFAIAAAAIIMLIGAGTLTSEPVWQLLRQKLSRMGSEYSEMTPDEAYADKKLGQYLPTVFPDGFELEKIEEMKSATDRSICETLKNNDSGQTLWVTARDSGIADLAVGNATLGNDGSRAINLNYGVASVTFASSEDDIGHIPRIWQTVYSSDYELSLKIEAAEVNDLHISNQGWEYTIKYIKKSDRLPNGAVRADCRQTNQPESYFHEQGMNDDGSAAEGWFFLTMEL